MEHTIADVARLVGTTSRTLRHYHDVGLLRPSRVGSNGYRYYDEAALRRLQRILMLRQLGLGLPAIAEALRSADRAAGASIAPAAWDDAGRAAVQAATGDAAGEAQGRAAGEVADVAADAAVLRTHVMWLRRERDRLDRQIASVERTISSIESEEEIMAEEMLDGFDHTHYREEVEQRWGASAWAESDRWWRGLDPQGRVGFTDEHARIAERWAALREQGVPADSDQAQANARRHHAWIATGWGGRAPTADQLSGLAEMYVADERFAANYGGPEGAAYVRDALVHFAIAELA